MKIRFLLLGGVFGPDWKAGVHTPRLASVEFVTVKKVVDRSSDRGMAPAKTRNFLSNEDTGKQACFGLAPGFFILIFSPEKRRPEKLPDPVAVSYVLPFSGPRCDTGTQKHACTCVSWAGVSVVKEPGGTLFYQPTGAG
jgi:hypothetical protein